MCLMKLSTPILMGLVFVINMLPNEAQAASAVAWSNKAKDARINYGSSSIKIAEKMALDDCKNQFKVDDCKIISKSEKSGHIAIARNKNGMLFPVSGFSQKERAEIEAFNLCSNAKKSTECEVILTLYDSFGLADEAPKQIDPQSQLPSQEDLCRNNGQNGIYWGGCPD